MDRRQLESAGADYPYLQGLWMIPLGIGIIVARYYWQHPHPISESEAKELASEYNRKLRDGLARTEAAESQNGDLGAGDDPVIRLEIPAHFVKRCAHDGTCDGCISLACTCRR